MPYGYNPHFGDPSARARMHARIAQDDKIKRHRSPTHEKEPDSAKSNLPFRMLVSSINQHGTNLALLLF
jgi:hypothetical protein